MADITLPTVVPKGDDQEWKRQVAEALRQLRDEIAAVQSQIGRR